jgi:glucans biosynthesis protein C
MQHFMTDSQTISARRKAASRRLDLDWLRIGAFGLLILYHIALVFGPWDWHINSRHRAGWVGVALVATNPWRLGLLFLISGVATRHLAARLGPWRLLRDRSRRLLIPLLFGALLFVPPQAYVEQVVRDGLQTGYGAFWLDQIDPRQILCRAGPHCTGLPLNHLWFVAYVWAYAVCAALLLAMPGLMAGLERGLGRLVEGWGALVTPFLWLLVARFALFPAFGITNHLLFDPYNHATSLALFLFGFLLAFDTQVWARLDRVRWVSLAFAVPSLVYLGWHASLPFPAQHHSAPTTMLAFALNQWSMIAAILGFGHRHLQRGEGRVLRYLREGIFPFYIVHQTVIVVATLALERWGAPGWIEFPALVVITGLACAGLYEMVRRIVRLRPLFGLRPVPAAARPAGRMLAS